MTLLPGGTNVGNRGCSCPELTAVFDLELSLDVRDSKNLLIIYEKRVNIQHRYPCVPQGAYHSHFVSTAGLVFASRLNEFSPGSKYGMPSH